MPYILEPQSDEKLLADIIYQPSPKIEPFRFAMTDRAVFLPAKRFVVTGDPTYFNRVPLSDVKEFHVEAVKPYGFFVASIVLAAIGIAVLLMIIQPGAFVTPRGIGITFMILIGAGLLPIAGKGRYRLVIRHADKTFRWVPPLVVASGEKRQVNDVLDVITRAAKTVAVIVTDERPAV
jgi:hypothetical protein